MIATRRLRLSCLAALLLFASSAVTTARAQVVLDVIAQPSTTNAGQSGSFDIIVQDPAGSGQNVTIGGFSVDAKISAGTGITFTGITDTTLTTYIFNGNSLGFLATTNTATEEAGNDVAASGGTTLTPGESLGLAHITYTVAANASSATVPVVLQGIGSATSLSNAQGALLSFNATNGAITIIGTASVPEPSPLVLSTVAGVLGWLANRRFRKIQD